MTTRAIRSANFERANFSPIQLLSAKTIFFACLYSIFFIYLIYHTFSGDRGLYALLKENRKFEVLTEEFEKVHAERGNLEHDVKLLRSESLDLDMLDEQVRGNLGLAGSDEVMVLQPVRTH